MESNFISHGQEEPIELPPGFRFHPTDDELIIHYLYRKVCDSSFASRAIGDVALNKFEPWDLPLRAKIGEKEWYFFCVRDRKYPTGLRTNRATESGYWKATGNDKEIYKEKALVGMKKTLVFYKGRAPNGEKTNWVMHEFRLDGKLAMDSGSEPAKGEWVISKVFEKSCGGKKIHISGVASMNRYEYENDVEIDSSDLPPLIDTSSSKIESIFDAIQEHKHKNQDFNQPFNTDYLQYHEPSIMRFLTNNENYLSLAQNQRFELRNDQDYNLDLSDEPVNLGCL